MKFKRFTALICSALLALCSTTMLSASAKSTGYVIDNDPLASSGFSHGYYGFTYHSFSGSYNGDARRASTGGSAYYSWVHPQESFFPQNVHYELKVYLNHSTFNDPAARYTFNVSGVMSDEAIVIDQNTAPSGFCDARTITLKANLIKEVRLKPCGRSGYYAGADAISIRYTYTPNN